MTSQLVIFRAFLFIIFRPPPPPPTLDLKKISRKSTNKKIWPYQQLTMELPEYAHQSRVPS